MSTLGEVQSRLVAKETWPCSGKCCISSWVLVLSWNLSSRVRYGMRAGSAGPPVQSCRVRQLFHVNARLIKANLYCHSQILELRDPALRRLPCWRGRFREQSARCGHTRTVSLLFSGDSQTFLVLWFGVSLGPFTWAFCPHSLLCRGMDAGLVCPCGKRGWWGPREKGASPAFCSFLSPLLLPSQDPDSVLLSKLPQLP